MQDTQDNGKKKWVKYATALILMALIATPITLLAWSAFERTQKPQNTQPTFIYPASLRKAYVPLITLTGPVYTDKNYSFGANIPGGIVKGYAMVYLNASGTKYYLLQYYLHGDGGYYSDFDLRQVTQNPSSIDSGYWGDFNVTGYVYQNWYPVLKQGSSTVIYLYLGFIDVTSIEFLGSQQTAP